MSRLHSRWDTAEKRILELGGKSRQLSKESPGSETVREIPGDGENKMKLSNIDLTEIPGKKREWDEMVLEGKTPENGWEMRMFRFRNYNEPQTREVKPDILLDTP